MDGTFFECSLIGQPKSKHFVLFTIDTANNELVLAKAFYSKNGSNSCTANQVIKALQPPIERAKLTNDLIIHTEYLFVVGVFHLIFIMILLKPFVIGSMTDGVSKRCRRENSSFQQKSIQKYSSRMAKKGIRN